MEDAIGLSPRDLALTSERLEREASPTQSPRRQPVSTGAAGVPPMNALEPSPDTAHSATVQPDESSAKAVAISVLVVLVATSLGSEFGRVVRFPEAGAAILFPPYAVLATALILSPPRRWWIFLLASFVGHVVPLSAAGAENLTAWTEPANASRALAAAVGLRLLGHARPRFDRLEGTAVFLTVAGIVAPSIGAFVGASVVVIRASLTETGAQPHYWTAWYAWFLSNALVGITLLPLCLIAAADGKFWRGRPQPLRLAEGALLATGLLAVAPVALLSHAGGLPGQPIRLYVPLPFLLWAAMRFGPGVTTASLCVTTTLAVIGITNGRGPFAATDSDNGVLTLYMFLAVTAVPSLLLAALVREREQGLSALREQQHRYRLATSAGGVGVWDWTIATNELYVDPALKTALGFADNETHDHVNDWWHRIPPADAERVAAHVSAHLEGHIPSMDIEHRVVHRDGSTRWFLARGVATRSNTGEPVRLVGTETDITERKRAERALQAGEERMALAASAASLGFWVWSMETESFWISDHGRRILGLDPNSAVTLDRIRALIQPGEEARVRDRCMSAVAQRRPYEDEFHVVRADGQARWLGVTGRLELDGNGLPTQMLGVMIDVTDRKLATQEAHERRRELAHLGRVAMLGQLSAALAHELRQPLTAIQANVRAAQGFLRRGPTDLAELEAILADIGSDDARAGEVIERLRALVKNDRTRYEPLDLGSVLIDAADIARGDLVARRVTVHVEIETGLPHVSGDRVELQQVLVNLVLNACDAMSDRPPAERQLTLGVGRDDAGHVVARIVDRGTGIANEQLEHVFEPFVTSKAGGLGLGLAICRTIVTAHRGRLWAENNTAGNVGVTFFLSLPATTTDSPRQGFDEFVRERELTATGSAR